jgi:small GTP-binding protein
MSADAPAELLYKVLVIGDGGTGKTCLIRRYIHSVFNATSKATIGVDFALKVLAMKNRTVTLQLWDIAGQERHGQMTRVYYQAALGAAVVCDITKPETLDAAVQWKLDLDSKVFIGSSGKNVPCVLLLNKCDLGSCTKSKQEMDNFCQEHGFAAWFETSAKDDVNVDSSFQALVEEITKATAEMNTQQEEAKPKLVKQPARKDGGCKC